MHRVFVVALVVCCATSTLAQPASKPPLEPRVPWYQGKHGKNRIFHLSLTVGLGLSYLVSETVAKDALAPDACRWCEPPSFDRSARNNLVWNNTERAHFLSSMDAYVVAPIVGFGLLALSHHDTSATRLLDDLLPIAETVAISQVLTQIVKFSVGRARPYVRFGTDTPHNNDENLSFWSGHSALGFGITASAGLVAHWRGYWTEPYIWGAGIAISLSTEYLRMAADRHYLSDVLMGGFIGIGTGLVVPRLMRRDVKLVPMSNGAGVTGTF